MRRRRPAPGLRPAAHPHGGAPTLVEPWSPDNQSCLPPGHSHTPLPARYTPPGSALQPSRTACARNGPLRPGRCDNAQQIQQRQVVRPRRRADRELIWWPVNLTPPACMRPPAARQHADCAWGASSCCATSATCRCAARVCARLTAAPRVQRTGLAPVACKHLRHPQPPARCIFRCRCHTHTHHAQLPSPLVPSLSPPLDPCPLRPSAPPTPFAPPSLPPSPQPPSTTQIANYRKEIAELLRSGKQDYARIRVEAVIRESLTLQARAAPRRAAQRLPCAAAPRHARVRMYPPHNDRRAPPGASQRTNHPARTLPCPPPLPPPPPRPMRSWNCSWSCSRCAPPWSRAPKRYPGTWWRRCPACSTRAAGARAAEFLFLEMTVSARGARRGARRQCGRGRKRGQQARPTRARPPALLITPRVPDLPELVTLQKLFTQKYGKEYVQEASSDVTYHKCAARRGGGRGMGARGERAQACGRQARRMGRGRGVPGPAPGLSGHAPLRTRTGGT